MGVSPVVKVLQLTKKVPFPIKDGESMAIYSLAESLVLNGAKVDLLSMNTQKHRGVLANFKSTFYKSVSMVDINTGFNLITFIFHFFTSLPYQLSRFYHKSFKSYLINILLANNFDYIFLETIYLMPYVSILKKYSKAKIVLRTHNLEYEIWNRLQIRSKWGIQKFIFKIFSYQIHSFESKKLKKIDFLISISQRELEWFMHYYPKLKSLAIPITWNSGMIDTPLKEPNNNPTLFFIGSLDWKPNLEGLCWFLHHIWPLINAKIPNLSFYVAGRNMPENLKQLKIPNVTMIGEVENSNQFINLHDICIVPLLSGSGMRAKIIEAMAMGKVVVTTSMGLEGIKATDGFDVCVADTSSQFLTIILDLISNPLKIKKIGFNARNTIKDNYDSLLMGKKLITFLKNDNI